MKLKYIILAVILTLTATFFYGRYLGLKKGDNASQVITDSLTKVISKYQVEIDNYVVYVTEKEQEIKTLREAKKDGDITNEALRKLNIKKVQEITSLKAQLKIFIDSIPNNPNTPIVIVQPCDSSGNALSLPIGYTEHNEFFEIDLELDMDAKLSMNLNLPVNIDVITGWDKKEKRYKAVVTTDNPYLEIKDIRSVKVDLKKPSKWGIGAIGGWGVNLTGQPAAGYPFIGFGVYYSLIRF
jgi:hypothetical protein